MRWFGFILVPTVALAGVDGNGDGCDDTWFDTTGACVDVDATVDPTATLGSGSSIGPFVDIGPGVTVAPRASLAGRDDGAAVQPVGEGTYIGRQAAIGTDATIGLDNTLGRAIQTGTDLTTQDDVIVGYGVLIGDNVTLQQGATVGNLADVGDWATIGQNVHVGRSSTILDGADAADGAVVLGHLGPEVTVGRRARIEANARVRRNATIGEYAHVMGGVRVSRNATVGVGAHIATGATVRAGGTVCAAADLEAGDVVERGETWPAGPCAPPVLSSCREILARGLSTGSGPYTIDVDGASGPLAPFDVECDMVTAGGGWTQLVKSAPASTHPGWGQITGYNTINDVSHISPAWHVMTDFTEVMDSQAGLSGGDITNCWTNESMAAQVAKPAFTCTATAVTDLPLRSTYQFSASTTHQGCALSANIAYSFHTWDGGISGSWTSLATNGYKTNTTVNCGTQCVKYSSGCLATTYTGAVDNDARGFWVR